MSDIELRWGQDRRLEYRIEKGGFESYTPHSGPVYSAIRWSDWRTVPTYEEWCAEHPDQR